MKNILSFYRHNPVFALIINCVIFFVWAMIVIFIMIILAVAFTR